MRDRQGHSYDEPHHSTFDVDFNVYNYRLDTNTLNDEKYSAQLSSALSTKLELLAQHPAVDEEF